MAVFPNLILFLAASSAVAAVAAAAEDDAAAGACLAATPGCSDQPTHDHSLLQVVPGKAARKDGRKHDLKGVARHEQQDLEDIRMAMAEAGEAEGPAKGKEAAKKAAEGPAKDKQAPGTPGKKAGDEDLSAKAALKKQQEQGDQEGPRAMDRDYVHDSDDGPRTTRKEVSNATSSGNEAEEAGDDWQVDQDYDSDSTGSTPRPLSLWEKILRWFKSLFGAADDKDSSKEDKLALLDGLSKELDGLKAEQSQAGEEQGNTKETKAMKELIERADRRLAEAKKEVLKTS